MEENLSQPQITPTPPSSPKPSKGKAKFLIPLIVLALLVGGYFALAKYQNLWPFKAAVSPSPTPDETVNWETYRNTKFNYEFRYPHNVGVVSDYDSSFIGPPSNPEEDLLLISDKEKTFHFQINGSKISVVKNSPLAEQILSTFKFIK